MNFPRFAFWRYRFDLTRQATAGLPAPLRLACEPLEPRIMLSTVQIIAAGVENTEQMQLLVDGVVEQTFDDIGGDAYGGQFETYTWETSATVIADDIRIQFTNDLYEPPVDRNLRIDAIVIDGVRYETESPDVFSTGTWKPEDGIVAGFRESEFLHAAGYFQYSGGGGGSDGSTVLINAAGFEGDEIMQLLIDGSVVQTWTGVGGDPANRVFLPFEYTSSETISIEQVRIAFTNDVYDPPVTDRNLQVDNVIIDGVVFETEDPSVFSTGTWKPNDGITPGFRESELLHSSGYFQYAQPGGNNNPGVISLETSVISVTEDDGFADVAISRTQGSNGQVTVDYRTIADSADPGEDYTDVSGRVTFADGQTLQTVQVPLLDNNAGEPVESFTFTIDNVLGGASLLAPRTATISITDDDFVLPSYPTFDNATDLQLNGAAALTNGRLRLTRAQPLQAGSAWYDLVLPINPNTSFETNFSFSIAGGNRRDGGDGMAFVIQNSAAGAAALGPLGGGLGYSGIENSVAIEFDTFAGPGDVNENHVSLVLNGDVENALATKILPFDLNTGQIHNAWVDYNGLRDELSVYVSDGGSKPATPFIVATVDLNQIVGDQGWLGFTAATGAVRNKHDVRSWDLNLNVPPPVEPPGPGDTLQSVTVQSGFNQPTAIQWTPDGQNMYVAEKSGNVSVVRNGVLRGTPFIDISAQVNNVRDRGLLDIAVHPDFENNPYVYLLFTYDPPEVFDNVGHPLAGPDQKGNRAGRLIRVTADVDTNYTRAVAGSEVVLLGTNSTWGNFNAFANSTNDFGEPPAGILPNGSNLQDFINSDSESHSVGGLDFGPDGALYVSTGDGASYNQVDPRAARVQDIDNLSGKILRIDPITGAGLSDNPFFNGDDQANRSKVYQYGLRNPFRIAVDQVTGAVYIGDVGWGTWEEVNSAGPGANFGWPWYEGASGTLNQTGGYRNLPEANDFYNSGQTVTPAIYALNHSADGINAIVLGDNYYGSTYPAEYDGDLFFNDLGQGIVRNLSFNGNGSVASAQTFTTGAEIVVQIRQGPDGNLYYVDLDGGTIGRWVFV